jgi:hypothetical protein
MKNRLIRICYSAIPAVIFLLFGFQATAQNRPGVDSSSPVAAFLVETASGVEVPGYVLYPNPLKDGFWVNYPLNYGEMYHFRMIDLGGRILWEDELIQPLTRFERRDFPPGIYVYEITHMGRRMAHGKVVVVE